MLSIFFRVVSQILCTFAVGLGIACSLRRTSDGIDVSLLSFDATMCLRRRTEDAETTEVEIEQIG